ncbi:MAG: hypothetical protein DHS20C18_34720 [Saprospiraceae bacterium]|nr:MAG: hypothetical protein DHS20C18_34720 [Saprospiraceae bacterium]
MPLDYFAPNFYFTVTFLGLDGLSAEDIKFQSVAGLNGQIETESIKEGGENRFEHVVPTRAKFSDLILKRGVLRPDQSGVTEWCKKAIERQIYEPSDLLVSLLNENAETLMQWKVIHAYPKNWKIGDLNAEKGEVLVEAVELNYNYFEFQNGT